MKYMGSKRAMLNNGLGVLLGQESVGMVRFFDLFAGSGAVSTYIARNFDVPVFAFDLQKYSAVLTDSVIGREREFNCSDMWRVWLRDAKLRFKRVCVPVCERLTQKGVRDLRGWCADQAGFPVTRAYGGYYFSAEQAMWIDALLGSLPERKLARTAALAALIRSGSRCAAAPGHTAQPFQPTRTAKPYLADAWKKDIVQHAKDALFDLASQFARVSGKAEVGDANEAAKELREGDLAFVDPPYSGVHYSRFYHVLETIARIESVEVSGEGRYPPPALRPRSGYSVSSESTGSLDDLLRTISSQGARAIVTFPDHHCSNGLSGDSVRAIAGKYFRVRKKCVESKFSTLGGTSNGERIGEGGRSARVLARELMLVLNPI